MVAEPWEQLDVDALVLEQCATALDRLYERIVHRFGRVEVRAWVRRYMAGLLQRLDRKNSWQVAEAIGEAGPQGLQRLLTTPMWDAEAVCASLPLGARARRDGPLAACPALAGGPDRAGLLPGVRSRGHDRG